MILPQEIRHQAREYSADQKVRQAFCDGAISAFEWWEKEKNSTISETTEITDVQFEDFWELYDKKVGKVKSEKLWNKLSKADKQKCLKYIPLYVEAQPDKQYRKNPETFLRNHGWQDEIINRANRPKQLSPEEQEREYLNSLAQDLFAGGRA